MARSRQLLHYLLRTADGTDSRLQAEVQVWIEIRVRYVKQARPTNTRQELAPYFFTLGGLMADQRQQKLLLQGGTPWPVQSRKGFVSHPATFSNVLRSTNC